MKYKLYLLVFFTSFITITVWAQESIVHLAFKYTPNAVYVSTNTIKTSSNVDCLVADSIKEQMGSNGVHFPMRTTSWRQTKNRLTVGKSDKDSVCSLEMEIIHDSSVTKTNGLTQPAGSAIKLTDLKISGRLTASGKAELLKLENAMMPEETKKAVFNTMKSVLNKIDFPEKDLAIGDTVSFSVPMKIPIGEEQINVTLFTVYKLERLEGDKAFFSTDTQMKMDFSVKEMKTVLSGRGQGSMIFNVKDCYYEQNQTTMHTTMRMVSSNITVLVESEDDTNLEMQRFQQE